MGGAPVSRRLGVAGRSVRASVCPTCGAYPMFACTVRRNGTRVEIQRPHRERVEAQRNKEDAAWRAQCEADAAELKRRAAKKFGWEK